MDRTLSTMFGSLPALGRFSAFIWIFITLHPDNTGIHNEAVQAEDALTIICFLLIEDKAGMIRHCVLIVVK